MLLRQLKWSDYARARDIIDKTFDLSELPCFAEAWTRRHPTASYAMTSHGALLGFILISTSCRVEYVAVDPEFQGCAIGTQLLTRALRALRDTVGARAVWLKTADDRRLRAWYERHGFKHYYEYLSADKQWIGDCMVYRMRTRSAGK